MKLFLQTPTKIRIVHNEQEFSCAPDAFRLLEPDYPDLPTGIYYRYWTPDYSYLEGANGFAPDPLNCLPYIEKVPIYLQVVPVIYAHITLSQEALCVNHEPAETIFVTAALKPSLDPQSPNLPVNYTWFIRLRHEDGLAFDAFPAEFVAGACAIQYTYREGIPLGRWELREIDFALVNVGGQTYQVKLVNSVSFTLYREL